MWCAHRSQPGAMIEPSIDTMSDGECQSASVSRKGRPMPQNDGTSAIHSGRMAPLTTGESARVYFARAIDGEHRLRTLELASTVARELAAVGLLMIDPMADEPVHSLVGLDQGSRYRAIVDHDLATLRSCQAVLMDMSIPDRNYIGCICEMTYAYLWQIPCVIHLGEINKDRPWLHYHATAVFKLRSEAIAYLGAILRG